MTQTITTADDWPVRPTDVEKGDRVRVTYDSVYTSGLKTIEGVVSDTRMRGTALEIDDYIVDEANVYKETSNGVRRVSKNEGFERPPKIEFVE